MEGPGSPNFKSAVAFLSHSKSIKTSTTTKLELYGLFKHVTVSPSPTTSKPSIFDPTGRAKWDAWNTTSQRYTTPQAAEDRYLEIARDLGWTEEESARVAQSQAGTSAEAKGDTERHTGGGGMSVSVSTVDKEGLPQNDGTIHGLAITNDHVGLLALIQSQQVDLNEPDEFGYTPLHLAADRGNAEVVGILLREGADATIKDPDDLFPHELAQVAGHEDIAAKLVMAHTAKE
ncbi:ankyrin [Pluteus cervinus]|uniref:Ankyrin n=1 Tax=Pluteus cervinus TaxID=181527 RepID=A0ACD3BGE2_9AGAR|nr:ankyrin [Pluteus cervinus]